MPRQERQLGVEDTPLLRFAGDLRRLRRQAGQPSYRELGRRARYSAAALSEAVAGRRLPSLAVTVAFVAACEGDVEAWRERWRELAASDATPNGQASSPYVGLAAYQVQDADRFFGREALTETLARLVDERPFVGVFGASGAGKSSLLRAGLAAESKRTVVVLTPGSDPVTEVATVVAGLVDEPLAHVRERLAADPHALRGLLSEACDDLLLIVDQFEEVFTLCADDDRLWLVRALTAAASPRGRVVLGVRADFYGHCSRHPELVAALYRAQLMVGPMSPDELRRAVTEPAARAGASVESALLARLMSDVTGQPSALPLVSHVLAETWRRRRGMVLTLAGYQDVGGVEHALARTAEHTFQQLTGGERDAARLMFLRLVTPGDGTEDTKRRLRRDELGASHGPLERFAAARLVSVDDHGAELAHEALLRAWPRLTAWIAEDRDLLRAHRLVTEAATAWQAHDRDPDLLWRGERLTAIDRLLDRLNPVERDFLDAGLTAQRLRETRRRRRRRRLRVLIAALSVLVVLLTGAVGLAVTAKSEADHRRNEAISLRAADTARALLLTKPRDAAALALAAYRISPTAETRAALILAHAAAGAATLGEGYQDTPLRVAVTPRTVRSGKYSGYQLWRRDGTAWRPAGVLPGGAFLYSSSADGRRLLTWHAPTRFHLWDVSDPDHPREIAVPDDLSIVNDLTRDGGLLVATGADRTTVVWRVADGSVRRLPARDVEGAALVPDGSGIVLTRRDGGQYAVELWSLDGARIATLMRTLDVVYPYAGPAGTVAVVGTKSGKLTVLRFTDPRSPRTMVRAEGMGSPTWVVFDPQGRTAAALDDDSIRMWDLSSGAVVLSLHFDGLPLTRPRLLSATGELLVLNSGNGALWQVDPDLSRVIHDTCAGRVELDWNRYLPDTPRVPLCG
ncbi:nSTAND1 domain-containing NTPase [Sphaerisporangium rhizosphaerae]|uniref:nSTAND1 domain-containing NTPase n=1 Tax=Sphaerisporangium rhizosphaerae TaxID=2269375 RepID=UPI0036D349BC